MAKKQKKQHLQCECALLGRISIKFMPKRRNFIERNRYYTYRVGIDVGNKVTNFNFGISQFRFLANLSIDYNLCNTRVNSDNEMCTTAIMIARSTTTVMIFNGECKHTLLIVALLIGSTPSSSSAGDYKVKGFLFYYSSAIFNCVSLDRNGFLIDQRAL